MLVWFIYDISGNKARNKVSKLAEKTGLYRVQKSVFLGNINSNIKDEIVLQSKQLINIETDSLYVFPMCEKDFNDTILIGQNFDKDFVTDKLKALVL